MDILKMLLLMAQIKNTPSRDISSNTNAELGVFNPNYNPVILNSEFRPP